MQVSLLCLVFFTSHHGTFLSTKCYAGSLWSCRCLNTCLCCNAILRNNVDVLSLGSCSTFLTISRQNNGWLVSSRLRISSIAISSLTTMVYLTRLMPCLTTDACVTVIWLCRRNW